MHQRPCVAKKLLADLSCFAFFANGFWLYCERDNLLYLDGLGLKYFFSKKMFSMIFQQLFVI